MRRMLLLVAGSLIIAVGCSKPTLTFKLSVTPTPPSWSSDGFITAFEKAKTVVKTISITDPVDWWQLRGQDSNDSKTYNDAQIYNALRGDLTVFVQVDPYVQRKGSLDQCLPESKRGKGLTFASPEIRDAYTADVMLRVKLYKPEFIVLVMEADAYADEHPEDIANLVSLVEAVRGKIKTESPSTTVAVSFQYENITGSVDGRERWDNMRRWQAMDAIAFTTYPASLVPAYADPQRIPSDYYSRAAKYTAKPILFAEVGWPASDAAGEVRQKDFLSRLATLWKPLPVKIANYYFLYDCFGFGPTFDYMGLITKDGREKQALSAWRNLR